MTFDYKKEFKTFYLPKQQPAIVEIPSMNFIAVRGQGDPNQADGDYQRAIQTLYGIAYTIRMSYKTDYQIEGYFPYVVPPLEGFWWQEDVQGVDYSRKADFHWISVIRLPDFVSESDFDWAVRTAKEKKNIEIDSAEFLTIEEGLCVQAMHIGPFDQEPETVQKMTDYMNEQGYHHDFNENRRHHEIYLSDFRKVTPDKLKTVIRHPIK